MITIENIDLGNNSIYLEHTNTGQARYIFFDEDQKVFIMQQIKGNKRYLFEDQTHSSYMNPDNENNIIKRIKKDLNLIDLSPHMFRHTFITSLFEHGVNIESIHLLVGHSDYSMLK